MLNTFEILKVELQGNDFFFFFLPKMLAFYNSKCYFIYKLYYSLVSLNLNQMKGPSPAHNPHNITYKINTTENPYLLTFCVTMVITAFIPCQSIVTWVKTALPKPSN